MSILIADSGSTKTDWAWVRKDQEPLFFKTVGLNPYFTTEDGFKKTFKSEVVSRLDDFEKLEIYFYGAGCGNEAHRNWVSKLLKMFDPIKVEIESDLLGAARALLQYNNGIACILGTGSNAGIYSEGRIVRTAPSLGYVLGDEGGGAWLGKQLVTSYLRQEMPHDLYDAFDSMFNASRDEILQKIYREPAPNRYLASFAGFISSNKNDPWIKALLVDAFSLFFWRYILPLEPPEGSSLGLTGAVAVSFQDVLSEVAATYGFFNLFFGLSPVHGLVKYHGTV
jgi:glucosamine kinase